MKIDVSTQPPLWWRRLSRSARFCLTSVVLAISGNTIYDPELTLKIIFWLGIAGIFFQASDIFLGSPDAPKNDEETK